MKEGYTLLSISKDKRAQLAIESLCRNKRLYKFKLKGFVNENKRCICCNAYEINNFKYINPEKYKYWDYEKNNGAKPEFCKASSHTEYWFICENKHNFKMGLDAITCNKSWCPYCSGRYPTPENNFAIINPERAKCWDYSKNDISPECLLPSVPKKKFWFICEKGHSFKMTLNGITSKNSWCPECLESKGEKKIVEFLKNNNMIYIPQKEFDGLIGLRGGKLSYDFYLPKYNLLIEYQGEFHDGSTGEYSQTNLKRQREHDRRKREYSSINNIKLLEIWYWDLNNIEEILNKNLKDKVILNGK